jgi:hypothetical protein
MAGTPPRCSSRSTANVTSKLMKASLAIEAYLLAMRKSGQVQLQMPSRR